MRQSFKSGLFAVAFLLTAAGCTSPDWDTASSNASTPPSQTNFTTHLDALLEKQRAICLEPQYAALRLKSPCNNADITFERRADNTKISPALRAQVVSAYGRMDEIYREITDLYHAYGTPQSKKIADARRWAYEQSTQNRLKLVHGDITWGQYLDRRIKIRAELMQRAQP